MKYRGVAWRFTLYIYIFVREVGRPHFSISPPPLSTPLASLPRFHSSFEILYLLPFSFFPPFLSGLSLQSFFSSLSPAAERAISLTSWT